MENLLKSPGMPTGRVTLCAVSSDKAAGELRRKLKAEGIQVYAVPAADELPVPCRSHPDMLLCHLGGRGIVAGTEQIVSDLRDLGLDAVCSEKIPKAPYPFDIYLNCLILGNLLFGNLRHLDPAILRFAEQNSLKQIHVSQGYTRCSVCVADDHSIITADPSIQKAAEKEGIEVLFIRPGHITLPGYDYGFIGGCCGHIGKEHIAFCGQLGSHPDGERIRAFLSERKIMITELPSPDGALWDIGGIIPLLEK